MELDSNLLKEFAKMTNDSEVKSETKYLRGTIVSNSGGKYVQLDGSSTVTPISEIVNVEEGDRVLVTIENHKATIVGNFTFPPSARKEQEALDKAEDAKETADGVSGTANAAQQKAQEASDKADEAINQSSIASTSADEAKQQATEAIDKANSAQENIQEAKDLASQASADATEAKNQAAASQASSANAQAEVTRLNNEVNAAKEDIDGALEDLQAQADEITAIKETYSTKVEVGNTKAELETTITKKVGELQTTVEKDYATKTENVALEGRLQTQITQNAEGLASQVSKTEKLEADTEQAQKDVADALSKANAAQTSASEAQTKANAAQAAANAATADAQEAADKAQLAQNAADAATAAANAADQAVQDAQGDLDEAKQNLANVTSRVDATEADIAEAQAKVDAAQQEVNEALADAAEARTAADKAQTAADKAQQDAETAQSTANTAQQKATNAQTAADNAQAAADQAQADVAALTKRVTTAETKIEQNSEAITLNATKTEEVGTKLDNLKVGGRNLVLNTNGEWSDWWTPGTGTNKTKTFGKVDLTNYVSSTSDRVAFQFIYEIQDMTAGSYYGQGSINGAWSGDTVFPNPWNSVIPKTTENWNGVFEKTYIWPVSSRAVDMDYRIIEIGVRFDNTNPEAKMRWKCLKVEIGTIPTDWTPAPEDIENNLANNYYTKTETDAQIKVQSDRITSTVSKVETVEKTANAAQNAANKAQTDINNLEIGGRNLIYRGRGNVLDGYFKNFNSIEEDDYAKVTIAFTTNGYKRVSLTDGFLLKCRDYEVGKQVTYSYDIMFTQWDFGEGAALGEWWMGQRYTGSVGEATEGAWRGVTFHTLPKVGTDCELNEWIHVSKTFTIPGQAAEGIGSDNAIQVQNRTADTSITITLCIKNVKIEYGNRETDWTPSPEEINDDLSNAQNTADEAKSTAEAAQSTASYAQSVVEQLSNVISQLVTDANGTSMMTQTSTGWTFNISSITSNLETIQNGIKDLSDDQSNTSDLLSKVKDLVDAIDKKTAYINIGTDDNGDPCIELGKADNDFKVRITNTAIDFMEGSSKIAYANNNTFYAEKMIVKNELQIGEGPGFVWRTRANGNMGLVYISG